MHEATTEAGVPRARTQSPVASGEQSLTTSRGRTTISDTVVAKIAGLAARDVSGVHAMGAGTARALGAMRGIMVGDKTSPAHQGVSVEVGERQAAVDVALVVEYGTAIPDLAAAVRRNVITAVERMCGLEVTEVNIKIDDVRFPGEEREREPEEPRVR
ncbi:Asp23/Gls24 family envelope stress response protein [Microtetraspora sp. NBRC 13810]|uniref:Asp23/Gls24 family envelope stress response protein n=1 Tax=Microtetraspora sp. NBRC 13810 TaxID=3030990 RepID=UPI00255757E5|nr:Asp23/Gls24 family envelope stress response protein [Microtetraspora sp. NBRC 13810]